MEQIALMDDTRIQFQDLLETHRGIVLKVAASYAFHPEDRAELAQEIAATHLYLGAQRERRFCSPKTRFLIHQPSGGAGGLVSDIALQTEQIIKARERIAQVIAQASGQPIERVRRDIDRDL